MKARAPKHKVHPDFVIHAEVYNHAQVGVFRTWERFKGWHDERKLPIEFTPGSTNACAVSVTDPDNVDWFVAYVPKETETVTVCHECLHLAWYILDSYGVKVDIKNHEALAYLQQHLSRQILSHK